MLSTASQSAPAVTHGRVSSHNDLTSQLEHLRNPLTKVAPVADSNQTRPYHLHHQPHSTPHKHYEVYSNNNGGHNPHQNQSPKPQLNSSYNHSKKHRERTHSNTSTTSASTTAIDPKTLQYTSKLCGTSNTITVSSLAATSHTGGPAAGGTGTCSTSSSMATSAISTTTTFYSGVKLAPRVLNASVENIERRTSDQKAWYVIQVIPYDLKILSATTGAAGNGRNSSNSTSSNGMGGNNSTLATKTCIPRKAYRIYRRYEDVADFADQLEEEFPRLIASSAATSLLRGDSKDSNATAPSPFSNAFGIHDNVSSAPGSSAISERGTTTPSFAAATMCAQTVGASAGSAPVGVNNVAARLPRLKSRLVLFVTKAVCLQRKEELDRYLLELFALGPLIAQSRLVAEFFGIWKTDMEIHLSQEDRDPLALNSVSLMTSPATTATTIAPTTGMTTPTTTANIALEYKSDKEQEYREEDKALADVATVKDCSSPTTPSSPSPSSQSTILRVERSISRKNSNSSFDSSTICIPHNQSARSTIDIPHPATYLASPAISPNPKTDCSRDSSWMSDSLTQLPDSVQYPSAESYMDSDMASPIDVNQPDSAELKQDDDITSRTIKKFKSLRRSNISTQSQEARPQQDILNQDDLPPTPGAKIGNSSTIAPTSSGTSSSHTTNLSQALAHARPKTMKRSKTTVFRPEVSMQPLSSKNVIPPWNRIPLVTGNTGSSNSPISPVSPTTPTSLNSYGMLFSSVNGPNTIAGENATATTPTVHDPEDRPRKMTMSHSKTMSAISSISSFSYWGSDSSSTPATSNASSHSTSAVSNGNGSSISVNGGSIVRSRSTSSSATTLVAPWNRVSLNTEPNTHLHSLIKVSGSPSQSSQQYSSSSNSTYIPVELGRSLQKKELQKSHAMAARSVKDQSVPILAQPPEARNKTPMTSRLLEASSTPPPTRSKGFRSGMTHSVSAPSGFLPLMTVSAPGKLSASYEAQSSETTGKSSFESAVEQSKTPATKKRSPRRESTMSLNSPSQSTKQPVGILKNSQNRKASLTVPVSNMFPVQSSMPSTPTTTAGHHGQSIATTFKIVIDADTIVALQVFEDKSFVLTLKELRTRVQTKLLKSNIQLSENFDLVWVIPSSASSPALNAPATPSTPTTLSSSSTSSTSIHRMSDPGVTLRSEEDLQRAVHSSRNHKVTLRCML